MPDPELVEFADIVAVAAGIAVAAAAVVDVAAQPGIED